MPVDTAYLYGQILGPGLDAETDTDRLEKLRDSVAEQDEHLTEVAAKIEALDALVVAAIDDLPTPAALEDWHGRVKAIAHDVATVACALVDAHREVAA